MRPSSLLVITTVFLASTSAFPHRRSLGIPLQRRSALVNDGIVDLDALRSHAAHSETKYLQGITALQGNAGEPTSSSGHLSRRAGGDDSLTVDWSQYSWYGSISVGLPAVEYKVDFDTGSADLFLPAVDCDSSCDGHTRYDTEASSSAVDLHQDFTLVFGDGSVSGEQYTDTVSVAGMMAKNQTIGAAFHYSPYFSKSVSDGLMGMSFANISVFQANPFVQSLVAEGLLSDPVFAFKLTPHESELRIGGVNPSLYRGPFTYTPVTRQGFWEIGVDSINANGRAVSTNATAIVDTGTSFILGNAEIVNEFYSAVNATNIGGGFYTLPCNAMPNVSVTIQGKSFDIAPDIFNLGLRNSSSDDCVGGIVAQGDHGDTWILGDVFLRNVYSLFDLGGLQVGFADLA